MIVLILHFVGGVGVFSPVRKTLPCIWLRYAAWVPVMHMPPRQPISVLDSHEVMNQPPPLVDYNLFDSDAILRTALEREGAGWAADKAQRLRPGHGQRARGRACPCRKPPSAGASSV